MQRSDTPRRGRCNVRNLKNRFFYFSANAVVLYLLYGSEACILYLRKDLGGGKDVAVEFWLWVAVFSSWVAYLMLQGSEPGYIDSAPPVQSVSLGPDAAVGAPAGGEAPESAEEVTIGIDVMTASAGGSGSGLHDRRASRAAGADDAAAGIGGAAALPAASPGASEATRAGRSKPEEESVGLLGVEDDADYDPQGTGQLSTAAAQAQRGFRDCKWCHERQPLRAHHCRECNRCVATFDHHCSVVATCIGEKNRARFLLFLVAQATSQAFAIGILNTALVYRRTTTEWVGANAAALAALVVLWLIQLPVLFLTGLHVYLAAGNMTTYELATGSHRLWYLAGTGYDDFRDCDLPFSKGLTANCRLFCCVLDAWECCGALWCKRRAGMRARALAAPAPTPAAGDGAAGPAAGDDATPATAAAAAASASSQGKAGWWSPYPWEPVRAGDRNSTDVCGNLWENRYWSCC